MAKDEPLGSYAEFEPNSPSITQMIKNIRICNFRSLRDVELDIGQFTVIVGPNASGKTSILEAVDGLLRNLARNRDKQESSQEAELDFNLSDVFNRNIHDDSPLLIAVKGKQDFRLSATPTPPTWRIVLQTLHSHPPKSNLPDKDWKRIVDLSPEQLHIPRSCLLRFEAAKLALPSYIEESPPTLRVDGTGLASALAYLALNQPDEFQALQDSLREVIPSIRRIRFDKPEIQIQKFETFMLQNGPFLRERVLSVRGEALLFDTDSGIGIPGPQMSEGTILVLGVLTMLTSSNSPDIIMLDDIERGLHPKAQENFVELLQKFLGIHPNVQILATTHSPLLLNRLNAEDIRITTLRADGSTACGRLDEHPQYEEWKDAMAPGEFWSLIGENWLVEAPTKESVS